MTETEKRQHRACFTGHRPEKLIRSEVEIKHDLEREILRAIDDDITVFITGMARGVDLWAAEIVLRFKAEGKPIKLISACPYDGFEQAWSHRAKTLYQEIIKSADLVRYINPHYSRSCFQIRNEWMVDHAARVIAVFNGEPSGTKNTIDYALKTNIPVIRILG